MGFWHRISILTAAASTLGLAVAGPAKSHHKPTSPIVSVQQGNVKGFVQNDTSVYLGIPFAETTAGENRWKAPKPIDSFPNGRFDASNYGPSCAQVMSGTTITNQSEDCLNLNIWTPRQGKDLPVFVYIYGGAMVTGGSSNAQWQGFNFAREGVIYVNLNYRESIYASPNAPELQGESQNFGILDVDLALEWIHDNIEGMFLPSSTFLRRIHANMVAFQLSEAINLVLSLVATPPAEFMLIIISGITLKHS